MGPRLKITLLITRAWCWLTGADAVWIKDTDTRHITVKVMRTRFDPFSSEQDRVIRFRRYGARRCSPDGQVGGGAWLWRYVDESKHVQHTLTN